MIKHGVLELDTHANKIVFLQNFILLYETGREYDVLPYIDEY